MPDFTVILGAPLLLVGVVMLLMRPTYLAAGVVALGLGILGWSPLLGAVTFAAIGGLILLFGNPYRRRTSISIGRPEGERTGSSPSNTP